MAAATALLRGALSHGAHQHPAAARRRRGAAGGPRTQAPRQAGRVGRLPLDSHGVDSELQPRPALENFFTVLQQLYYP
jgi:hypothetical protein